MIPVEFFSKQGIMLPVRDFLNPQEITDLIREMQTAPAVDALVFDTAPNQGYYLMEGKEKTSARKTREIVVSQTWRDFMHDKLVAILPQLNDFYQLKAKMLNRREMLQFLKYVPGDYFHPHQDWNSKIVIQNIAPRLISFTLFLNLPQALTSPDSKHPGYEGGELGFYLPHAKLPGKLGLAVKPEAGMLITFLPEVVHGVKPILSGERYTIVGWFQ